MIAMTTGVHIYAHPQDRENLIEFYTTILGWDVEPLPGSKLVFRFPDHIFLSVEFTEDALAQEQLHRGAWLQIATNDPETLKQKVLAAGMPQVIHISSDRFYFQAPGGQVWGIVGTGYGQ